MASSSVVFEKAIGMSVSAVAIDPKIAIGFEPFRAITLPIKESANKTPNEIQNNILPISPVEASSWILKSGSRATSAPTANPFEINAVRTANLALCIRFLTLVEKVSKIAQIGANIVTFLVN